MIPDLHSFQADLFERIRQHRRQGARIIIAQAPTGAGKNTIAAHLVRESVMKERRVLFMVHRRKLVDQISERLHQFEVQHAILMRGRPVEQDYRVQVASRDTLLSRCIHNAWVGMPSAEVVLVDEAHHAGPGSEYRRILDQYPQATIILVTATPVDADGNGLGPWAQALVCSAPTSQLVRDGYLVPVRVYSPERQKSGKLKRGIAGDLVASWQAYAENRPTVLFCARVQHSKDAVKAYLESGIPAQHVDSDTPEEERDRAFADLECGTLKVISNVGIVGEGVDVPALGCCQIFCEMGGRVRFLQACGRIMRPFEGKQYGILIDHAGAVFRHGFPDEDSEWALEGNCDGRFRCRQEAGQTAKALWCKACQIAYHGRETCPQCGRPPVKPPRSIFAPAPVEVRNEFLTEADRNGRVQDDRKQKVAHWFRCLFAAKKRGWTFTQASSIYFRRYREWPANDFPCLPAWEYRRYKINTFYPDLGKRRT